MKLLAYYNDFGPVDVNFDLMTFSGGESHVKLKFDRTVNITRVVIKGNIISSRNLMDVVVIANAIRNYFPRNTPEIDLFTGYLPYSRSDRVCAPGEEFGLQAFAQIINSIGFTRVYTIDPHSEVAFSLINNLIAIDQMAFIKTVGYVFKNFDFVCAPDKGSVHKVEKVAKYTGLPLLQGTKKRDPETGKLSGFGLESVSKSDTNDKNVIIVDDICDGGGTFIGLAKVLREEYGVKEIALLVSHGLYSKGTSGLTENNIAIYCINDLLGNYFSFADYDKITNELLVEQPEIIRTLS